MDLHHPLRRTNSIIELDGIVLKTYRDLPFGVSVHVLFGMRPAKVLSGNYRFQNEQSKIKQLEQAGYVLPYELLGFYPEVPAMATLKDPHSKDVETMIRESNSLETSLRLIGQSAASLKELHFLRKKDIFIHGDPYLENFLFRAGKVIPFDFEQEYTRQGEEAVKMDYALLFWHAHDLLREIGHQPRSYFPELLDTFNQNYLIAQPTWTPSGLAGKFFQWRFHPPSECL